MLSRVDQCNEFLLMGLRVKEGVHLDRLKDLSNGKFSNNIKDLSDLGMLIEQPPYLSLTDQGRPLLNAVLAKLTDV